MGWCAGETKGTRKKESVSVRVPHSGAPANTVKQTHAICNDDDDDRDDDDGL